MPPHLIPEEKKTTNSSVLVLVLIFILLVAVSVYMFKSGTFTKKGAGVTQEASKPVYTSEKVVVTGTDLSATIPAKDKIPSAFAKDLPLPAGAVIIESLTSDYPERMVTLSTLVYTTSLSQKEIYALYEPYFTKNGYVTAKDGKKADQYITSTKNNDDFGVIIGTNGKNTTVNVTFLDRR